MRGLFCSLRVEPKEGRYVHEHEAPEDYDLLGVSMICLGENKDDADNDVLKMLNLLVDRKMNAETKVKRLETELGLKLSDSGKENIKTMSTLADGLIEEGRAEGVVLGEARGEVKGKAESIMRILDAREYTVSNVLREKIFSISTMDSLDKLLTLAVTCASIEEFEKASNKFLS